MDEGWGPGDGRKLAIGLIVAFGLPGAALLHAYWSDARTKKEAEAQRARDESAATMRAMARVENGAKRFCESAAQDAQHRRDAFHELEGACLALAAFNPRADTCTPYRELFARALEVRAREGKINDQLRNAVGPASPPAPEYEPPEYVGAFWVSGTYRPQDKEHGVLVEAGGKFFAIENAAEPPYVTGRISGYVDPTGRTVTTEIGRLGREAQVVRVSSRETYLDDRRAYKEELARVAAEYKQNLRDYPILAKKALEAQQRTAKERESLELALDANGLDRERLLAAASSRLVEKGLCHVAPTAAQKSLMADEAEPSTRVLNGVVSKDAGPGRRRRRGSHQAKSRVDALDDGQAVPSDHRPNPFD
jgi:hypothetical protein